jgi:hypothetical protein
MMSSGPFCKLGYILFYSENLGVIIFGIGLDAYILWLSYFHSIICSCVVPSERNGWLGIRDSKIFPKPQSSSVCW